MTQTGVPAQIIPITDVRTVARKVQLVADLAGGGEHYAATALERQIWESVLEAVAGSNAQAGYLAAEALKTNDIDFPRTAVVEMGPFTV